MIGNNIQRIRKRNGISLSELAERAEISKSYLSSIERNLKKNPSIHVVEKIAHVLNVDLKSLLLDDMNPSKKQKLEKEWLEFIYELKKVGIGVEQIEEYKMIIEFMKWYKNRSKAE